MGLPVETNAPHLRTTAEQILNGCEVLLHYVDPRRRPVAGLRAFVHEDNPSSVSPMEILPDQVRPAIIFDLDDTMWEHVRHVVTAVSEATGIPVTWEEFLKYGHTRKIPVWRDNPEAMAIHDQIQQGAHPNFFPFVNRAWPRAIETVEAVDRMGHDFCYLTARSPQLFGATLRAMEWNSIPHDHQRNLVDAKTHEVPENGMLYCAHTGLSDVNQYKLDVVNGWRNNLRRKGRNGLVVVVDDLLKPYQPLVESGDVVGIALSGPLNQNMAPCINERRVSSWDQIGEILMDIHSQAVAADSAPFRLFDCRMDLPGTFLVAAKKETGNGEFLLTSVNHWGLVPVEKWQGDPSGVLQELGIT